MGDTFIWDVEISEETPPPEIPWVPVAIMAVGGMILVAGLLYRGK